MKFNSLQKQGKKFRRDGKDKWTEIKSVVLYYFIYFLFVLLVYVIFVVCQGLGNDVNIERPLTLPMLRLLSSKAQRRKDFF